MRLLVAILILGQVPQIDTELDCDRPDREGRCDRVGGRDNSDPLINFAPLTGVGMGTVCSGAAITDSRGLAVSWVRATSAICSKSNTAFGGTETAAVANGDWVTVTSNQPRVEYDGTGVLGIRTEYTSINDLIRSAEICNAAWTDVGTPNCTSDQAIGPFGTTTMDQLTDNDGAAFEGRAQAITNNSATIHSAYCMVKGNANSATLTMVGTGSATGDCTGTVTGLSLTTSSRVTCTSPAAYGGALTAVTVTIKVGTATTDQGTIFVEACQHEYGLPVGGKAGPTSHIATAGAPVTRNTDVVSMSRTDPSSPNVCVSGRFIGPTPPSGGANAMIENTGLNTYLSEATGNIRFYVSGNFRVTAVASSVNGITWSAFNSESAATVTWGASTATGGALNANNKFGATVWIGGSGCSGGCPSGGIISRVKMDPNPAKCTQP